MGRKSLSQYFLTNPDVARKIAEAVGGPENETLILEIGGGTGILTHALCHRASKLITVEIDSRLAGRLKNNFLKNENVEVLNCDIFDVELESIHKEGIIHLCGNIPYHISGRILRWISENHQYFATVALMVQEEVGRRICGSPGNRDYGILTVALGIDFQPEYLFTVSRHDFNPQPKVDSAVIRLLHREQGFVDAKYRDQFFRLVKKAFSSRRKKLRNSLVGFMEMDSSSIVDRIKAAGLDSDLRAEMLSINDYLILLREFQN